MAAGKAPWARPWGSVSDIRGSTSKIAISPKRIPPICTKEEAVEILREKIRRSRRFVLSAVKGDFGEDIESSYMGVALLQAGQEVRMRRVRERSYEKFGERMLPGGDLYKKEEGFFARVAQRSEEDIAGWVSGLSVPVLVLDGERPISEHLERISTFLHLK